jgi:hypothetical protein
MAEAQVEAIAEAIDKAMAADEEGAMLCCTIETTNVRGKPVSLQVMRDSLNIAPYPFNDDPLGRLWASGVIDELDVELELVDWKARTYATIGIEELDAEDVAQLVDRIFVHLLGCDDASYRTSAATDDLG